MPIAASVPIAEEAAVAVPTLEQLYEQHAPHIRTLVARLLGPGVDPEDLTHEVFLVAWRKREQFARENMLPWLRTVAIKLAAVERRKAWVRRTFGLRDPDAVADWQTPERAAEASEARRRVYAALNGISEKRRTVFILYELQGLSGQEIAHALDCPLQTVWSRLFHARRDFAERIRSAEAAAPAGGGRRRG